MSKIRIADDDPQRSTPRRQNNICGAQMARGRNQVQRQTVESARKRRAANHASAAQGRNVAHSCDWRRAQFTS